MVIILLAIVIATLSTLSHAGTNGMPDSHSTGVKPLHDGVCPAGYPIKGNFTTHSGERCIYHMLGQRFYNKTKAERCYANEVEAVRDGCRKSKV
jgi:hypothetical protein